MKRLKQHMIQTRQRQRGAVAIIVGISIFVLVGMIGLVVDLGHLYVAKSELQNAADAAALAGAKELNGTVNGVGGVGGVNRARDWAIAAAGRNKYDLNATAVIIGDGDLQFSSSPDGPWVGFAAAQASPVDKTFLKVDTGLRSFNTWFIHVLPGATSIMRTFGMAVAGRYVIDVAPLGVCAVDKRRQEQGFIRGVAYNVTQLNPLGGVNSDALWVNPVNAPPDTCDDLEPSWNSSSSMVDFVCTGKSVVPRSLPGEVFVNTGTSSSLEKALNSRFGDYQGSKCSVVTAPPDANVKEYPFNADSGSGGPRDWMEPGASVIPSQQGITILPDTSLPGSPLKPIDKTVLLPIPPSTVPSTVRTPPTSAVFSNYGVLWSYSRERNFATGGDHTLCDWSNAAYSPFCSGGSNNPNLYKGHADQTASGYPPPVPAASNPPYFRDLPINPTAGVPNRRVLNMLIIDCDAPTSKDCGNKGIALNALAIGKFFMPVKANLPDELYLEFVGAISTLPPADIRLYK